MTHISFGRSLLILAVMLPWLAAQSASRPAPSPVAGVWRGEVQRGGATFEVFFEIRSLADGQIVTRVTVPKAALRDAIVGGTTFRERELVLEVPHLGGRYRGTLSDDGDRISGAFVTKAETARLDLTRVPALPASDRPQEPRRPYPYRDEEVTFVNEKAGITFYGTLTIPKGPGPHPAAVMVTGAGCQDRDETVGDLKPFLVIADDLTRRGIAVLRFDDRGYGPTKGNFLESTSEDVATDLLAGVRYLAGRPDIARDEIGVIGHSEGGMIAMIAASQSPDVSFAVSLAGVAVKCDGLARDLFLELAKQHRLSKPLSIVVESALTLTMALMKSSLTDAQLSARLKLFLPDDLVPLIASRWSRFMVKYDPAPAIEKVKCPILGIYLSSDVQVPAATNAPGLEAAAKRGGNKDVTVVILPGLDHIFRMVAPGPADAERARNTVATEVLDTLGAWIAARTRRRAESR